MLIFNNLWDGICEGEIVEKLDDHIITTPKQPTIDKNIAIWKRKDKNAYVHTDAIVCEEVIWHITSAKISHYTLNKLKDLFETHP